MSSDEEFEQFDYDEYVGTGAMQSTIGDSDTTILFRDLQHELEALVQNYHVPLVELEQLFQVVQAMFDLMDANKESFEVMEAEKKELEMLWKQEKDKLKATQMRKLELESRLEEEMMKIDCAKTELEKEKVTLTTKLKQVGEHKQLVEQELQKMKDRTSREEQTRKELLEQYKKQSDVIKTASLRRLPFGSPQSQGKRRTLPHLSSRIKRESKLAASVHVAAPVATPLQQSVETEPLLESAKVPEEPFTSKEGTKYTNDQNKKRESVLSLADELEQVESNSTANQNGNGTQDDNWNQNEPPEDEQHKSGEEDDDEAWYQFATTEGISFAEELMGVDPLGRAEVEMLQKEKEIWEEDRTKLEEEKHQLREQKEVLERQNAELEVELRRARETNRDVTETLSEVKKERDEILDNYLEQPFDEYCITRRELHGLLTKHHDTTLELEKAKEEKRRLQRLLDSKRGFLERMKEKLAKMFSKKTEERHVEKDSKPPQPSPFTFPTPFIRSLSTILSGGNLVLEKGWLKSHAGHVKSEKLPQWLGQITLKGFETDRIECIAVGRIYSSALEIFPGHLTPPRFRAAHRSQVSTLNGIQQTHAEVWVATVEQSMANIEIVDVLAKPIKVRQTFLLRPKTKHIICMKSIPGAVEESKDFADSATLVYKTDWVETSYLNSGLPVPGHRTSDLSPFFKQRERPRSAPQKTPRRSAVDLMIGSSPDLSRSRARDSVPLEVDLELFTSSTPALPSSRLRSTDNGILASNSSSSSLATIDEVENTPEKERVQKGENQELEEQTKDIDKDTQDDQPDNVESGISILESDSSREGVPDQFTSTPIRKSSSNSSKQNQLDISPLVKENGMKARSKTYAGDLPSDDLDLDTPDGRMQSIRNKHISNQDVTSPLMWIITEDNYLYFYPTTDPSHRPINCVKIKNRATCMEFVAGKVFVGHVKSTLTVYHKDEFAPSWDVENPEEIALSCPEPGDQDEVRCIAGVGDRVWVGVGSWIFCLNAENPSSREGSIPMNAWKQKPEHIVSLGDVVAVATRRGSTLFIFDSHSAHLLKKFDIAPVTRLLNVPPKTVASTSFPTAIPTDIKTMVTDDHMLYIGTSNGRLVSIPKESIVQFKSANHKDLIISFDEVDSGRVSATRTNASASVTEGECLETSAIAIHSHKDSRVKGLVSINLPLIPPSKVKEAVDAVPYHSLPNLSSPFGTRIPVTPPILSYRSLVISAGKGHVEYVEDSDPELEESMSGALRERNETFQLQCWGHRNIIP